MEFFVSVNCFNCNGVANPGLTFRGQNEEPRPVCRGCAHSIEMNAVLMARSYHEDRITAHSIELATLDRRFQVLTGRGRGTDAESNDDEIGSALRACGNCFAVCCTGFLLLAALITPK
jgi:hypothetical protein